MTRHATRPLTSIKLLVSIPFVVSSFLFTWPHAAGSAGTLVHKPTHSHRHRPAHHPTRETTVRRTHDACEQNTRSIAALPAPLVSFQMPYVPGVCDPMHLLPKQAWWMFACIRWHESGDQPNEPNGAGMYQFTNQATWNEFRGSFAVVPSDATALQQDTVAYRAWKAEQFLPWTGDPCVGSARQYGKWGWY